MQRFVRQAGLLAWLTWLTVSGLVRAQEQPLWREQGVVSVRRSPYARLHDVPVRAVRIREGFWAARRRVNAERSIPTMLELLEANGVIDNFRRLTGKKNVPRTGPLYTDSDIYKWIEAAAWVLHTDDRPDLRAKIEEAIDEIVAAQEPSGYLNTYYVDERKNLRFQEMDRGHELYCLGHLLQGAIAYYRATGSRRLLDAGIRFVNYLIETSGPGKRPLLTGHPELEMALVELYRTEGDKRYLELAGYLLGGDERLKLSRGQIIYMFSGIPFVQRTQLEGHAVRAMYACSGATDYYLETGDRAYWQTLERLWEDLVRRKMYITGGVGSRAQGEAFGEAYELPNARAYTESCAAIGNFFWNWRMLLATGEARFADVMERALYNGINSGMSLDGTLYCYRNPLELSGNPEEKIRNPWYRTTCCPPNLERVLASLPGYLYSTSQEGLWVHLYENSELDWRLEDGTPLRVEQQTRYPWEGKVRLVVYPARPAEFTLYVRIPGWSEDSEVRVNGAVVEAEVRPGTYLPLKRRWQAGDQVELAFDMEPRLTVANPRVGENRQKAALERGPLVYALEGLDQPPLPSLFDVELVAGREFVPEWRSELLGGIMVIRHRGRVPEQPWSEGPLYRRLEVSSQPPVRYRDVELRLIPYYTFANREPSPMMVWVPLAVECKLAGP